MRKQTSGFPRVECCITGCQRGTTTRPPLEDGTYNIETGKGLAIICGPHWRKVPKTLKRRRRALFKAWDRRVRRNGDVSSYWQLRPGSPERIAMVRLERLIAATWKRCIAVVEGDHLGDDLPPAIVEDLRRLGL